MQALIELINAHYRMLEQAGRLGALVPEISPELFARGEVLAHGNNIVTEIISSPELSRMIPGELVMKEYDLAGLTTDTLEMITRATTLGADRLHAENPFLNCPKGYGFTDTFFTIAQRYDCDVETYIARIRQESMDYLVPIARIAKAAAQGLALFHQAGGVHRDIKPSNIGIIIGEREGQDRVLLTDFDLVSRNDIAAGPGLTTRLSERRAIIGTIPFLPDDYLLGRKSLNELSAMELDGYALGITIKQLLDPWRINESMMCETFVAERMRYLSREEAWAPLEEALHRIAVRATSRYAPYSCMDELISDLDRALRGDARGVSKSTEHAWTYRKGEAEGRRVMTRRSLLRASIASLSLAAVGTPLWNIIDPVGLWEERQYQKEYRQSLEGLARKAAGLERSHLREFMAKESAHFKNELQEIYMPQLDSGARNKIAAGAFEGYQTPTWLANDSAWGGHMLARLHLHWRRTRDPYFMECYARYLKDMVLDVNPDNEYSDLRMSVVSRFESPLAVYTQDGEELRKALSPTAFKEIESGFMRALCASTIALHQYSEEHQVFGTLMKNGRLNIYPNQERLMQLLFAISALDDRYIEKVLGGQYDFEEMAVALLTTDEISAAEKNPNIAKANLDKISNFPKFGRLGHSELYLRPVRSGIRMLEAAFDGIRSYTQAFVGKNDISRKAGNLDPGYEQPEHFQPCVAQDHVHYYLGGIQRIVMANPVAAGSYRHEKQIRKELGGKYAAFIGEIAEGVRTIASVLTQMDRFYRSHLDKITELPPEYLMMASHIRKQIQFTPLMHDALAASRYGYAMLLLKHPAMEQTLSNLLMYTPMNYTPRMPHSYKLGTLTSARVGKWEWHGTSIEADRYFDEMMDGYEKR
jgi:hypothetical protein